MGGAGDLSRGGVCVSRSGPKATRANLLEFLRGSSCALDVCRFIAVFCWSILALGSFMTGRQSSCGEFK